MGVIFALFEACAYYVNQMKRFIFLLVIIVGLVVLLSYQATKSAASAVFIPSALKESSKDIQRIRVAGKVANAPIDYQTDPNMKLTFNLRDTDKPDSEGVPVIYLGLKPDMFAVGRDVIIDGDFIGGTVQATNLLTQCPSKYEPPTPTK
jgi:cytochrome c-type biogenesis protein CcmE